MSVYVRKFSDVGYLPRIDKWRIVIHTPDALLTRRDFRYPLQARNLGILRDEWFLNGDAGCTKAWIRLVASHAADGPPWLIPQTSELGTASPETATFSWTYMKTPKLHPRN